MSEKTDAFIETLAPIATALYNSREKWVLPSVMIAQCAKETGWDCSGKYSYFGIKGSGVESKTQEYINGQYIEIVDSFRTYPDLTSACIDYVNLITTSPRYAGAVNNPDYKSAIRAIHSGGYATSPTYADDIISIIEDFDLTRFDVREEKSEEIKETNIDIEAYAMRTIRGDFGNGQERIDNFRKLGFSDNIISNIQNRVNELLAPVEKTSNNQELKVGDYVMIRSGATDLNNGSYFLDFVYEKTYIVYEIQDRGIVFADENGVIVGVVSRENIIK